MQGKIQKDYKKRLIHRLRIIQGQIKGLEKMVEEEKYCIEILRQSKALRKSLESFDALMLKNHLKTHLSNGKNLKNSDKLVKEIIDLLKYC